MFHRTQRLFLRPAWPEDWQAVYDGICDEGVVRNLARAPWPYEREHARAWTQLPHDPASPTWLITLPETSELVGCIGIDPHEGEIEIGYWIARAHWAKGFATEAGKAVLEMARMMGHARVVASHYIDNPASGRVLRKLGFLPTGKTEMRMSMGRGKKSKRPRMRSIWTRQNHCGRPNRAARFVMIPSEGWGLRKVGAKLIEVPAFAGNRCRYSAGISASLNSPS